MIPAPEITGSGPASHLRFQGGLGNIRFISPITSPLCHECNGLGLSAAATLKPCLFSERGRDLLSALPMGADSTYIKGLIEPAVKRKPQRHHLEMGLSLVGRARLEVGGSGAI